MVKSTASQHFVTTVKMIHDTLGKYLQRWDTGSKFLLYLEVVHNKLLRFWTTVYDSEKICMEFPIAEKLLCC